jgi:hypothetical protein
MAGKDRLGAQAGYWLARAKQAAQSAAATIEERTGAVTSARRAADGLRSRRDRVAERSAQTRTGQAAGAAMRSLAGLASRLPLTGLTTDTIAASYGLAPLAEHLREHPDDPMAGARLLDAMARADVARGRYRAVRTVVDPTSWVTRSVSGTVAGVGREGEQVPFAERLGRSVYALAVADLREDPADGRAWHALARVHLARGDIAGARQLAKLAILADPAERAVALVTLARAELAAGMLPDADRLATAAVERGQSVGWEVRGDVHRAAALRDQVASERNERLNGSADWAAQVLVDDRIEYYGVHVDAAGAARTVAAGQQRKASTLADQARLLGTRASQAAASIVAPAGPAPAPATAPASDAPPAAWAPPTGVPPPPSLASPPLPSPPPPGSSGGSA